MNATTADAPTATATDQHQASQLRRSSDEKMLGGVAGGLARYLNADVTLVRAVIAALAIFTGAGATLYLAAWLLIPADGDEQSIAATWIASRRNRQGRTGY
jgi:phage shock protein PspC (stress-responsive transcriptional regulator)